MALTEYTGATDYVANLDDLPNDEGGLTADELKAVFDRYGTEFKAWFNETHIPEAEAEFAAMEGDISEAEGRLSVAEGDISGLAARKLSANMDVYVSSSGSDTTGDGTSGNPYKTIGKALSVSPGDLNGYGLYIYIAAGTYAENVSVEKTGTVSLRGASGAAVTLNGTLRAGHQATILRIDSIHMTINAASATGVTVDNRAALIVTAPLTVNSGAGKTAVWAIYDSCLFVGDGGTLTVNNAGYALSVNHSSRAFIENIAGSGNTNGLIAERGGVITYNSFTLSATTPTATSSGGRIYAGAQTSIPNY